MSDPCKANGILVPFNGVPHLFAVMNAPCTDGLCLLLMVTSIKSGRSYDATCVLNVGDHGFIKWSSYVSYRTADQAKAFHIKNMLERRYYTPKESFRADVFQRIASGIYTSEETRGTIIKYARKLGI